MKLLPFGKEILRSFARLLILFLRFNPVVRNKIVVLVGVGEKYDDNPKYIVEDVHSLMPEADIVWIKNAKASYDVPDWIRTVKWRSFRCVYEFATASVWIANCVIDYFPKRKEQLYIETWHGGLGIKKVGLDLDEDKYQRIHEKKWEKCPANVFISNSDHLSNIYRRAFLYKGPIWKCGYPKNDVLVNGKNGVYEGLRKALGVSEDVKIILYAPTWRLRFKRQKCIDNSVYNIDFKRVVSSANHKFGGDWIVVERYHPQLRAFMGGGNKDKDIVDGTLYPDMQELILASDIVISDYSSCIFDAALRKIPCFTYATDFEHYKNEERGVYYEMSELPFPFAKNNDELERNIINFDLDRYYKKWEAFSARTGLVETGHAAKDIAEKIVDSINGKIVDWKLITME